MKAELRESELRTLGNQLADAEAALAAKDKEIAALRARAATPGQSVAPASDQTAAIEQLRRERDKARETAANAETARADFQRQLQQAIEKFTAAQSDLAAANTAKNSLQQQNARLQADAEALKAKLAESAAQASGATKERDALTQQLTAAKDNSSAIAALKTQLADKEKEISSLQSVAKQTQTAQANVLASQAAAQSQLDTLRTERDALKQTTANQQARIDALQARLAAVPAPPNPAATDQLKKQLADTTQKLDASLRAFTVQQAEVGRLQKALDAERSTTAGKLADSANLGNELASAREQLRVAQAKAESTATENQSLKAQLASAPPAVSSSAPPALAAPERSEGGPATTPPPAVIAPEPHVHVVVSGDTLSGLAKKYYGSATRWTQILDANSGTIKNPDVLSVGTKLTIP
jgi:nucleoid-associated protein YgaU